MEFKSFLSRVFKGGRRDFDRIENGKNSLQKV